MNPMPIPVSDGLTTGDWPVGLKPGGPEAAGFDPQRLEQAFAVLETDIREGRIPGAVAVVARRGTVAAYRAMGWAQVSPERRAMQPDTIFDLASLTKVTACLPLMLHLLEQGAFRLDDPVQRFFPEFTGDGKEEVTIRHLLTHSSGLPSGITLPEEPWNHDEHIRQTLAAPMQAPPGTRVIYTDLGFVLMGELVERLTGLSLDAAARRLFFEPLGMKTTGYLPSPELEKRCAATEYREYLGRYQCGEVHDERATHLGGIAGHAGLFATALDVAAYGQFWSAGGAAGDRQLLSPATAAAATRSYTAGLGESRGWGWIVSRAESTALSCGDLFSPGSFGHTGFTGTSLWVDPAREVVVALLTNRVHFGRNPEHIQRLRPRFHNAVMAALR